MNERQRFGVFTVVPALIAFAPLFMPLYARFHPRAPQWLEGDSAILEVIDSMFLWAIFCPLYLLFALTQPEADIAYPAKRRLAFLMGTLAIVGVLQGFRLFFSS